MGLEEFKKELKGKNIHIVGVTGAEGSAILKFLVGLGFQNITGHDFIKERELERSFKLWHRGLSKEEKNKKLKEFEDLLGKIKVNFQKTYLRGILKADLIFVPQSWFLYKENYPTLDKARKLGIPFSSMTRLYLELAPCPVVAVTGTVGKGTVCALLCEILKMAGRQVYFGGNETWRQQVLDRLPQMKKEDVLVIEASNRQLRIGFEKGPRVAVVTNIYPDHLDEHPSFEDYIATKYKILERQTKKDIAVLNYDNPHTRQFGQKCLSQTVYFSFKNASVGQFASPRKVLANLRLPGKHNRENALAAATVAKIFGVKDEAIEKAFGSFSGLPGRLEFVAETDGVKFFDDIKSTTPAATIAALSAFEHPVILIMGGKTKAIDYSKLTFLIKKKVKLLLVVKSQEPDDLAWALGKHDLEKTDCQTLKEAVEKAKRKAQKGDVVLLSPAAAFFYSLFVARKKGFKRIISDLATSLPPK